jgi:hypothetical protein
MNWDPYETITSVKPNSDNVYVLSVPSFKWKKVYNGTTTIGRRGHRCHKISDNRMMVVGGVAPGPGCVVDQFVRVFNLNTLVFEDDYNPEKQDKYKVPGVITAIIGGE